MPESLNAADIIGHGPGVVFVRIPKLMQQSCGRCDCGECKGKEGFWDTLAVPTDPSANHTYTVHMPKPMRRVP